MTKPKPNGSVMQRIVGDLEEVMRRDSKLAARLVSCLVANSDTFAASELALQIWNDTVETQHILNLILREQLADAELIAERLAASDKGAKP